MDNNASQIDQIVSKTAQQLTELTQKIQNLIDTGDFSNVATATQANLFMSKLTLISSASNGFIEGFKKACLSILTRIGS